MRRELGKMKKSCIRNSIFIAAVLCLSVALASCTVERKVKQYTVKYIYTIERRYQEFTQKVNEGSTVTVSDIGNFRESGYTFLCWTTAEDGSGTKYYPNDRYTVTSDVTFYGQSSRIEYVKLAVKYDGNGATSGSVNATDAGSGNVICTVSGAGWLQKDGYFFNGWNTEKDGSGDSYSEGDRIRVTTQSITLYAQWKEKTRYNVVFDGNGAEKGEVLPSVVHAGEQCTFPGEGELRRDGFAFCGWTEDSENVGELYYEGDTVYITADALFYAAWESSALKYEKNSKGKYTVTGYDAASITADVIIQRPIVSIEKDAFRDCTELKSISIPDTLSYFGVDAFSGCTSLKTIIFRGTKSAWNSVGKYYEWKNSVTGLTVKCSDGDISID